MKLTADRIKETLERMRAAIRDEASPNFSVACVCGHAPEEHGHVPGYPGSTACTVEGCGCIAYERDQ